MNNCTTHKIPASVHTSNLAALLQAGDSLRECIRLPRIARRVQGLNAAYRVQQRTLDILLETCVDNIRFTWVKAERARQLLTGGVEMTPCEEP